MFVFNFRNSSEITKISLKNCEVWYRKKNHNFQLKRASVFKKRVALFKTRKIISLFHCIKMPFKNWQTESEQKKRSDAMMHLRVEIIPSAVRFAPIVLVWSVVWVSIWHRLPCLVINHSLRCNTVSNTSRFVHLMTSSCSNWGGFFRQCARTEMATIVATSVGTRVNWVFRRVYNREFNCL